MRIRKPRVVSIGLIVGEMIAGRIVVEIDLRTDLIGGITIVVVKMTLGEIGETGEIVLTEGRGEMMAVGMTDIVVAQEAQTETLTDGVMIATNFTQNIRILCKRKV